MLVRLLKTDSVHQTYLLNWFFVILNLHADLHRLRNTCPLGHRMNKRHLLGVDKLSDLALGREHTFGNVTSLLLLKLLGLKCYCLIVVHQV